MQTSVGARKKEGVLSTYNAWHVPRLAFNFHLRRSD